MIKTEKWENFVLQLLVQAVQRTINTTEIFTTSTSLCFMAVWKKMKEEESEWSEGRDVGYVSLVVQN